MTVDRNCLSFWFPRLAVAGSGLPVPRTKIVRASGDLTVALDGVQPEGWERFMDELVDACGDIGLPVFLRTGHGSGKHDWVSTCYVEDVAELPRHVGALVEWSLAADIMGLPTTVWAVRELIPTAPAFTAFGGHMPITREFRFFVRGGVVEHWQPYWPPDSIYLPSETDWPLRLGRMAAITAGAREHLEWLAKQAVAAVGGGFWSVDLLQDIDGQWWITDMAEGDRSFRWDPDAPSVERRDPTPKYDARLSV